MATHFILCKWPHLTNNMQNLFNGYNNWRASPMYVNKISTILWFNIDFSDPLMMNSYAVFSFGVGFNLAFYVEKHLVAFRGWNIVPHFVVHVPRHSPDNDDMSDQAQLLDPTGHRRLLLPYQIIISSCRPQKFDPNHNCTVAMTSKFQSGFHIQINTTVKIET